MAWYDEIANTTKGNVKGLVNALRNPQDAIVNQFKQGALYKNKEALAALVRGDTAPIMNSLNAKYPVNPNEAVNVGMAFNPMIASTFIGKGSSSWNPIKADLFAQLESKGVSPEKAWNQTGTLRGPEGALRQEISDAGSFLKGTGNFEDVVMKRYNALNNPDNPITRMSYSDIHYHPELYNAYPELGNIEARFLPKETTTSGRTGEGQNLIEINAKLPSNKANSSILHEMQHKIQENENFARGGSSNEFYNQALKDKENIFNQIDHLNTQMGILARNDKMNPEQKSAYDFLMNARNELVPEASKYTDSVNMMQLANDKYRNLAGEAESRLTQARMDLTPKQRLQNFPYAQNKYGLDVPLESLVIKK
jgi:hypothetical protein